MLKHYFKFAWQNLLRKKGNAAINILGLAIGISSCMLIYLYVQDELSYDRQFENAGRIFKIGSNLTMNGEEQLLGSSPPALAQALKEQFPQLEAVAQIRPTQKQTFRYEDKMLSIQDVYFTGPEFFRVFSYRFLQGNPAKALAAPNSIILTEDLAIKFFGSAERAMYRTLKTNIRTYQVTGVVENPERSHLRFTALLSLNTLTQEQLKAINSEWFSINTFTYTLLKAEAPAADFRAMVANLGDKLVNPHLRENKLNFSLSFFAQPLTDIHLGYQHLKNEPSPSGNRTYLYIFGLVGIFILLIACINYMNLATARSVKQAKEVGLRKVIGAHRQQLVGQYLIEAFMMTSIAALLGFSLVELLLPLYNQVTDKAISSEVLFSGPVLLFLVLVVVITALFSGSYPAFFLSGFNPIDVLRSDKRPTGANAMFRKGLVVLQFSISLVMIICTLVVVRQMHFLKNTNLGFNKEQVLLLSVPSGDTTVVNHLSSLKNELSRNPQIAQMAASAQVPGDPQIGTQFYLVPKQDQREEHSLNTMWVDFGFLELLNVKLVAGRTFDRNFGKEAETVVINQKLAKQLGWQEPVGKKLLIGGEKEATVIGVTEDFHYQSLHNQIEPLVILQTSGWIRYLALQVQSAGLPGTLEFIEKKWQAFAPKHPLEYTFLDESFNSQYRSEEKMLTVFGYFAGLTILIACLGLFGLASFTAEQRTKEIGIRKVLGSTVTCIVVLLTKDFARLVVVAIVVATPIAWYGMQRWLQDFAYRTEIHWGIFMIAGLLALVIAMLTVSYQAARAATRNPIHALHTE